MDWAIRFNLRRQSTALNSLIVLLLLFCSACDKDHSFDCFRSTGAVTTETRTVGDFYEICLEDNVNLYITQDTTLSQNYLYVEAGENLIAGIETEVSEGILYLRNANRCNWVRSYKVPVNVYLFCRSLFVFDYRGAGDIKAMNTVVADTLEFNFWGASGCVTMDVRCKKVKVHQHTGCGDAELTGVCQEAYYYTRNAGQIRCSGLHTPLAMIDSKNTNDSFIFADDHLIAGVRYTGNVWYAGHPHLIDSVTTERGRLLPLD